MYRLKPNNHNDLWWSIEEEDEIVPLEELVPKPKRKHKRIPKKQLSHEGKIILYGLCATINFTGWAIFMDYHSSDSSLIGIAISINLVLSLMVTLGACVSDEITSPWWVVILYGLFSLPFLLPEAIWYIITEVMLEDKS